MPPRIIFISLMASAVLAAWLFEFPAYKLIIVLATLLILVAMFGPKIIWLLGEKLPEERKAAKALAEHKQRHPEAYRENI